MDLFIFQESIPLRVKGLYIVNQPYIFNMVFQLFKPFLQEKLRSRIIFIGNDRDLLHKYVTPKCLPDCYGGTLSLPRVTGAQWLELLLMCDQEFSGEFFCCSYRSPSENISRCEHYFSIQWSVYATLESGVCLWFLTAIVTDTLSRGRGAIFTVGHCNISAICLLFISVIW